MGLLQCRFFSDILQTNTSITVTIPEVTRLPEFHQLGAGKRVQFPVMYVLHGGTDDSTYWMRKTRIEEYGQRYGFMTVSLDAFSSCYSNMVHGYRYFDFLTEELPRFVEGMFPASTEREDRIIAGFSMGGQGTLKAAFLRPEQYGAAMPLCGARDIVSLFEKWESMENGPDLTAARNALGPIGELRGSVHDLVHLARAAGAYKEKLPPLFVACANDDYAAELTEEYHQLLCEVGIEHTYFKAPGIHDYYFVDRTLKYALDNWLKLRGPRLKEDA